MRASDRLTLVILTISTARGEKRVALVIGNAARKNAATLECSRNDATDTVDVRGAGEDRSPPTPPLLTRKSDCSERATRETLS
jgi:hypothetical protein